MNTAPPLMAIAAAVQFLDVAPAVTWARVLGGSLLVLLGTVLLSHVLVVRARGGRLPGPAAATTAASLLRWGTAGFLAGVVLWGWELRMPAWALLAGAGLAAALAALDLARRATA